MSFNSAGDHTFFGKYNLDDGNLTELVAGSFLIPTLIPVGVTVSVSHNQISNIQPGAFEFDGDFYGEYIVVI